jgi:hypothetical protein
MRLGIECWALTTTISMFEIYCEDNRERKSFNLYNYSNERE